MRISDGSSDVCSSDLLAVLDRAVALDPESAPAHYYRGVVLYELSRYHDAVVALGRTIALASDSADGHFYRAYSFVEMDRFEEAIPAFRKALALDHFDGLAFIGRGDASDRQSVW